MAGQKTIGVTYTPPVEIPDLFIAYDPDQYPDIAGNYFVTGTYATKPYYSNEAKTSFIWWYSATTNWRVTQVLGVLGAGGFARINASVIGEYLSYGDAIGPCTVQPGT